MHPNNGMQRTALRAAPDASWRTHSACLSSSPPLCSAGFATALPQPLQGSAPSWLPARGDAPLCVSGHLMKSFPDFPDRLSTVSEETTPGGLLAGLGLLSLLLVFMVWIPQRTLISTVPSPDYKRFLQSVQMEECLVKTCVIQIHRDGCLASEQVRNILEREKLPLQTVNCSKSQECERFLLRTLGRGYWGYGWPVSNPTPTFLVGRKVLRGSAHLPEVMKFLSTR